MAKILLIEDDVDVIDNLQEILSLNEYDVISAPDGKHGIAKAIEESPDLIICDVIMPEVSGYDVLRTLRADPSTFAIPFLFLTAKSEKSDIRFGMELGADDYITKPFSIDEILRAVRLRLEKHTSLKNFYENKFDEMRRHITASLPHELRTPLNAILGFTQILQNNVRTLSENEVQMMLSNIYDAGKRLFRLVVNYSFYTALIDYKPDREKLKALPSESFVYEQALQTAKRYGRETDLIMNLEKAPVMCEDRMFSKLVEEIVDNAFKFSFANSKVEVSSFLNEQSELELTVKNYGRGLTESQISGIGAFIQFDRPKHEQQGAGLGLAIVKKIAAVYEGRMAIESVPGEYACVTVLLPLIGEVKA